MYTNVQGNLVRVLASRPGSQNAQCENCQSRLSWPSEMLSAGHSWQSGLCELLTHGEGKAVPDTPPSACTLTRRGGGWVWSPPAHRDCNPVSPSPGGGDANRL